MGDIVRGLHGLICDPHARVLEIHGLRAKVRYNGLINSTGVLRGEINRCLKRLLKVGDIVRGLHGLICDPHEKEIFFIHTSS